MMWGFFKKIVIADRLAVMVNHVYNSPSDYNGISLIVATYFFAFQIYCDFSGYSDIAIGAAQVFGFDLMNNFNRPYFSKNIVEFWKRWHISLSTWFRDYFYIPLGGNRVSKYRWAVNILVVFIVSGLWHGANWTFVLWGMLHGLYFLVSSKTKAARAKISSFFRLNRYPLIRKYLQVFITFHLVLFAWIFFRANSLPDALYIVGHLFSSDPSKINSLWVGLDRTEFIIAISSILFMEFVHIIQRHSGIRHLLAERPAWLRWTVYFLLLISIFLFGEFGKNEFIYFQF